MEEIVTGEAVVLDLPSARVPSRMLARLIDMAVQAMIMLIVLAAAGIVGGIGADDAAADAVAVAGFVLVIVGYPVLFETTSRGKTLGKLAVGLRVVSDDGGPVRFRQALVRALAGAVECWTLVGVPAVIASMFSERGKRLGDIFAGTFVLRDRAQPSRPVPWGPPLSGPVSAWVRSLDLSALPGNLAAAAASFTARYWELHDPAREDLGRKLASAIAARVSPPPPVALSPVAYLAIVMSERRARELARLAVHQHLPGYPSGAGTTWTPPVPSAPTASWAPAAPSDSAAPSATPPAQGHGPAAAPPPPA